MRNRSTSLLLALAATLVLAAATGDAAARRLSMTENRIRAVWSELRFRENGAQNIICHATLEGSFHSRTLSKVSGQLIGFITKANIAHPCVNGEAWFLNGQEQIDGGTVALTLPWHVRYDSFAGILPRIERIRLQLFQISYLLRMGIINNCLYRAETEPAFMIFTRNTTTGVITGLQADSTSGISNTIEEGTCPDPGTYAGTASVTVQGLTTAITAQLVA
jgi:hypothetical protein